MTPAPLATLAAAAIAVAFAVTLAACAGTPPATSPKPPTTPPAAPGAFVEEVPFIVTPDHVTVAMLEIAGVGPRDHVIDLGSGDGRIVITAARRFGASGLGVEIVPDLVARSRQAAASAGVADRVAFREQDLFATDLSPATVVTMYLLPEINLRLRPRLLALAPGTRIVSHDWDLGDWRPDRTLTIDVPDKAVGREKLSRVHLWAVPAKLDGLWCGRDRLSLRIVQRFQSATAALDRGPERRDFDARIDGVSLRALGAGGSAWSARLEDGDVLRIVDATPGLPLVAGETLRQLAGPHCP